MYFLGSRSKVAVLVDMGLGGENKVDVPKVETMHSPPLLECPFYCYVELFKAVALEVLKAQLLQLLQIPSHRQDCLLASPHHLQVAYQLCHYPFHCVQRHVHSECEEILLHLVYAFKVALCKILLPYAS